MAHEIFTEETSDDEVYQPPVQPKPKRKLGGLTIGLAVLGLLVGAGGGFITGLLVGKSASTSTAAAQTGAPNGASGFGRRMGTFGTVSAVSTSSITINDQRQGTTVSYNVTSDTTVTNAGASASIGDIKVGDTVLIRTADSSSSSTTTQTATSISLNPTMNGGPGSAQTQSSSGSSSSTSDSTNGI